MSEVEELIKTTLGEIERILSTKAVVGEPMTIEGKTIIPLVSIGFGFGGGGGSGGPKDKVAGSGTGAGGGGGIKPLGIIIIDGTDVRIEPVRGKVAGFVESVAEGVTKIVEKRREKKEENKEE
jgi:uncharacterized spore protein YtfJ